MMMKGDVLSGFSTIKVCTAYKTTDGIIEHLPFSIEPEKVSPQYIELPGWKEDLTQMTSEDEFPANFNDYIAYLEKELETPIKIVSVGPDRKQTIFR
jgi:adenylosuccinate synthase